MKTDIILCGVGGQGTILASRLMATAAKRKIPVQPHVNPRANGTDSFVMRLTRDGVANGLVSIPLRYMHSAVEMCDLRDAEGAVAILTETIANLSGKECFVPGGK